MIPRRTAIRHYIINMLKANVDVGERVFFGRANSELVTNELPAVNIHFGDEVNEVHLGEKYHASGLLRKLSVVVTVIVENQITDDEDPLTTHRGEDYLDFLAQQVEHSFNDDRLLARRLPAFDPNTNWTPGLVNGVAHLGTLTYDIETDGKATCIGQSLRYELPYTTDDDSRRRLVEFSEYSAAIIKVGTTEETVDPILLGMEGSVQ